MISIHMLSALPCRPRQMQAVTTDEPTKKGAIMSLRINDIAPDFTAETTQGPIRYNAGTNLVGSLDPACTPQPSEHDATRSPI